MTVYKNWNGWRLLISCGRVWTCILLLSISLNGFAQFGVLDVKMANNVFTYKKLEVPGDIVSVRPPPPGVGFQWESSLSPLTDFVSIAGATSANFLFTQPLSTTTYFRRKTILNAGMPNQISVYTNVIRIRVVSNDWEDMPYIRQNDVLVSGVSTVAAVEQLPTGQKVQLTTFMDGFGRMTQRVGKGLVSPVVEGGNWGDMVEFAEYDGYGNLNKERLPYPSFPETGKNKTDPLTNQEAFYASAYGESSPYDAVTYDNSPENRIVNMRSPGAGAASGSGNQIIQDLNGTEDEVVLWKISTTPGSVPVKMGIYAANSLFKKITFDEEGRQVIEYTTIAGQQILLKTQLDDNPSAAHNGWICTYIIYDDFGLLRYQIQPEAVKWLQQNSWDFSSAGGTTVQNEWCFAYDYDERGRNTYKKVAGASALYMLYDLRGRMVFTQDGNQRVKSTPEWMAYLYDGLDRNTDSYIYKTTKNIQQLEMDIQNAQVVNAFVESDPSSPLVNLEVVSRSGGGLLYTAKQSIEFLSGFESSANDEFTAEINSAISAPTASFLYTVVGNPINETDINNPAVCTLLKTNYFDDHLFSGVKQFDQGFNNNISGVTGEAIQAGTRTTGMLTGTKVRVLGTSSFLLTTVHYDEAGRVIQTLNDNIKGGTDITTNQYAFDGRLLTRDERHSAANTPYTNFSTVTRNSYDRLGRLTALEKKIGTNPFRTILSAGYDELGRIKWKKLDPGYTGAGKQELETLVYSYNIHGEITGVNKNYALKTAGHYDKWNNFFGFYLGYDNADGVFSQARFNGKVAGVIWNTQGDDAQRRYDFLYDNAGRLTKATFSEKKTVASSWSNAELDFSITGQGGKINYDLNGNLRSMIHKGILPGQASPLEVDNLVYAYASLSNKLARVTDIGGLGSIDGSLGDFKDGNNTGQDDYLYDENGNVMGDLNKLIKGAGDGAGIIYNFMDKPEEIRIEGKGVLKIVYDADGSRLQRIYTPNGGTSITTSYAGAYLYKGDELQYITFEEGRIRVVEAVSQTNGFDFLQVDGNLDLPGGKRGVFDFFIRDYQDNVRMVLTEEIHSGSNICTNEPDRADIEEPVFGEVDAAGVPTAANEVKARFHVAGIPGQSVNNGWQHSGIGNYVSRVGNLASSKVGPNSLLKVMAGDELSATSIYYYKNPVVNNSSGTTLTSNILQSLVQAISGSPVVAAEAKVGATSIGSALGSSGLFTSAIAPDAASGTGAQPKAYLSMIFFDERFNVIQEGTASVRVSQSGNGAAPLVLSEIRAPKNGYVYIYLSNENDEHVYFDNFQVVHHHGHILEENHYYAYGLRIAGISSRKLSPSNDGDARNHYLYNDKELFEDGDLNWYDYGFRNYDPQIGRFLQLDPLGEEFAPYSAYHYAGCDPISQVDWMGLSSMSTISAGVQTADKLGTTAETANVLAEVVITAKRGVAKTARAGSGFLKGVGRFLGGVASGIKETVVFTVNVLNPNPEKNSLVQVGKFVGNVITDPVGTYDAIRQQIKETDWSDPAVYGKIVGGLVTPGGAVKMVGYGAKAVKAAGKTMAKVSKNVSRKAVVVVVKESSENVLKIGCFVAGTLVWTPDGSIPIDSLKEGVLVHAYDTEGKNITTERVELAYSRRVDRLVAVKFGDQKILTTPEHPFYVRNGWLEAIDLKAGDTLFTTLEYPVVISGIRVLDTTVQVFNVTVSNQHNYFVGSERVLVHNNNPCAQAVNSGTKGAAKGVTSLEKASGSYLLEFQSGKFYAGKGLESRMMQSVNRIETTFGDKLLNKTFYPAANSKAAFLNEHNLMMQFGGPKSFNPLSPTYNKIFSPGRKLGGF